MRHVLRTVLAILAWVMPSTALALAGLVAVRALVSQEVLAATSDVVGNYLQTLGGIYAVLLAFVVFVVWNQFNDARAMVEREANELIDLYRTAKGLPEPTRGELHGHIRAYVATVLDSEWTSMAARRCSHDAFDEGARILDRMWNALQACDAATSCHQALFSEALGRFNQLSDVRTNRLTSSRLRIPLALDILLYTGAITIVASMYLFAVERLDVHMMITAAMAGAISHVLYIVRDLDHAFAGAWQVPRAAFERVGRACAG
ncbi:MAG TPA: DUF4239 domain-containing protein [Kofleriaceae bacterium]|nr:DUF4239 domain-containing protein [Kofleriaceae bacterium]